MLLLPVLLVLPALHLHPEHAHAPGAQRPHQHRPLVHADFLPTVGHDHDTHRHDHRLPTDHSSPSTPQINFVVLPTRGLAFSPAVFEHMLLSFRPDAPMVASSPLCPAWVLARDHTPLVPLLSFPPAAPRSPPRPV